MLKEIAEIILKYFFKGIFILFILILYDEYKNFLTVTFIMIPIIFIPVIILMIIVAIRDVKNENKKEFQINLLKKNGDSIIVNLEKNTIKSYETNSGNRCIVDFEFQYKNNTLSYAYVSQRSHESLRVNLIVKKETTLYINPKNLEEKYLDLEFLN